LPVVSYSLRTFAENTIRIRPIGTDGLVYFSPLQQLASTMARVSRIRMIVLLFIRRISVLLSQEKRTRKPAFKQEPNLQTIGNTGIKADLLTVAPGTIREVFFCGFVIR
jgi:hypothetical protein